MEFLGEAEQGRVLSAKDILESELLQEFPPTKERKWVAESFGAVVLVLESFDHIEQSLAKKLPFLRNLEANK